MRAWEALSSMLADGRSLSGHEQNCCFLNTRGPRFADVSAAIGLDHMSDSRGVATVDWDLDGDLDIWTSNRTGPRLRFMQNRLDAGTHFLALRLEGATCNRDAIGARVEVFFAGESGRRLVRTLRAGEGYLAQSSKWLQFGLGDQSAVERIVVHWPGGDSEEFQGVQADGRFKLVQGSGQALRWQSPARTIQLAASEPQLPVETGEARIVPHRRLPLPRLPYFDHTGRRVELDSTAGKFVLVNLWATWCQPCLKELSELTRHSQEIADAGLKVVAVNVDDVTAAPAERLEKAKRVLDQLHWPGEFGVAGESLVDQLDVTQRALLGLQSPLPVPCSFLLDVEGRLAVVYKGPVGVDRLLDDVAKLARPESDSRDAAVPFAGRWYVNPFPPDLLAIPQKLLEISLADEALNYLSRHVTIPSATDQTGAGQSGRSGEDLPESVSAERIAGVYVQAGMILAQQHKSQRAEDAFEAALRIQPDSWEALTALATLLDQQGKMAEALATHRRMLQLRPGHPVSANNVAWILATSPDASLRNPAEAIKYAEHVCRVTRNRLPSALDTLAAAYASAGRFAEAVDTAKKALALASESGQRAAADKIKARLRLYENNQPYRQPK